MTPEEHLQRAEELISQCEPDLGRKLGAKSSDRITAWAAVATYHVTAAGVKFAMREQ
jgi:hypothetical protein